MTRITNKTKDGLGILHRPCYAGRPDRLAALEEMRAADDVAQKILQLRTQAGLKFRP